MSATKMLPHCPPAAATPFETFLHFIANAALKPVRFYRARRVMTQLSHLSDHELGDIGLTRTDLMDVSALPGDHDPTSVLAGIVQERRYRRRGR